MAVTTYETVNGEILGETRGGVERDYVPDPLGSVAALIDSSQAKTDTFTYWPYGEERSHTGTSTTPFRFVGTLGYYRDDSGRSYVRARHLLTENARWLTVDPLWPDGSAYGYVRGRPINTSDSSGLGETYHTVTMDGDVSSASRKRLRIGTSSIHGVLMPRVLASERSASTASIPFGYPWVCTSAEDAMCWAVCWRKGEPFLGCVVLIFGWPPYYFRGIACICGKCFKN